MAAVTALDFDRHTVERAYDRWAPIYDLVFGAVFERGRQASLGCLDYGANENAKVARAS